MVLYPILHEKVTLTTMHRTNLGEVVSWVGTWEPSNILNIILLFGHKRQGSNSRLTALLLQLKQGQTDKECSSVHKLITVVVAAAAASASTKFLLQSTLYKCYTYKC